MSGKNIVTTTDVPLGTIEDIPHEIKAKIADIITKRKNAKDDEQELKWNETKACLETRKQTKARGNPVSELVTRILEPRNHTRLLWMNSCPARFIN